MISTATATDILLRPFEKIPVPTLKFSRVRRTYNRLCAVHIPNPINFVIDSFHRPSHVTLSLLGKKMKPAWPMWAMMFVTTIVALSTVLFSFVGTVEASAAVRHATAPHVTAEAQIRTDAQFYIPAIPHVGKLPRVRVSIPGAKLLSHDVKVWHQQQAAARAAAIDAAQNAGLPSVLSIPGANTLTMRALNWALAQQGKPYIWGGTGPDGFDCSGLVYAAYLAMGHPIPRDTYEMLAAVGTVLIPVATPQRGDLAFFGTGHVELWWKPGWTYGAQQPGTNVGFHQYNAWWHPTAYYRIAG